MRADDSEALARRLLESEYGLSGSLKRLSGENVNYLVTTRSGDRYVLKVAPADRSGAVIDMEYLAVRHALDRGVELRLPGTVLSRAGNAAAELPAAGGEVVRAQLLEFVDGTPWCDLKVRDAQLLADLGCKLASLDRSFCDFAHPAMHRTHRWDLTALHLHRGKAALVDDRERRRTLEWAFDLWASCRRSLPGLPASYIHADANDENLLVEHNAVTGLLDFGDGLYNPVVCNLAIALAYAMLDRDDPLDAGSRVVAAYHGVRPLAAAEFDVLFPLVCGRLANTVAVAAERRRQDAGHPNWFVTEGGAWALLGRLGRREPAEALARLTSLVPGRA